MDRRKHLMQSRQAQRHRAGRATCIVGALCLASCIGIPFRESACASAEHEQPATQTVFDSVMHGASFEDALGKAGFAAIDAAALPSWFDEEIIDVTRLDGCHAAPSFDAVLAIIEREPDEGFDALRRSFEEKGWLVATDDGQGALSMIKEKGACRWMTVSATKGETAWDAALRIQRTSPEPASPTRNGDGS